MITILIMGSPEKAGYRQAICRYFAFSGRNGERRKKMTDKELRLYDKALEYAARMHDRMYRTGGAPYITHPVMTAQIVIEHGGNIDAVITALFHDLLEDTDATEQEIERIGGSRVLRAVKLLTKPKNYIMEKYVGGIMTDETAILVKGADRLHNLRSALCCDEYFKRKYIKETREWYMDLLPEIPEAVRALEESLGRK